MVSVRVGDSKMYSGGSNLNKAFRAEGTIGNANSSASAPQENRDGRSGLNS